MKYSVDSFIHSLYLPYSPVKRCYKVYSGWNTKQYITIYINFVLPHGAAKNLPKSHIVFSFFFTKD